METRPVRQHALRKGAIVERDIRRVAAASGWSLSLILHESSGKTRQRRNQARTQETRIVACEPASVLRQT